MPTTPIPDFVAQLLSHPDLSPDSQDSLFLTDLVTWAVEKQGACRLPTTVLSLLTALGTSWYARPLARR